MYENYYESKQTMRCIDDYKCNEMTKKMFERRKTA